MGLTGTSQFWTCRKLRKLGDLMPMLFDLYWFYQLDRLFFELCKLKSTLELPVKQPQPKGRATRILRFDRAIQFYNTSSPQDSVLKSRHYHSHETSSDPFDLPSDYIRGWLNADNDWCLVNEWD